MGNYLQKVGLYQGVLLDPSDGDLGFYFGMSLLFVLLDSRPEQGFSFVFFWFCFLKALRSDSLDKWFVTFSFRSSCK